MANRLFGNQLFGLITNFNFSGGIFFYSVKKYLPKYVTDFTSIQTSLESGTNHRKKQALFIENDGDNGGIEIFLLAIDYANQE